MLDNRRHYIVPSQQTHNTSTKRSLCCCCSLTKRKLIFLLLCLMTIIYMAVTTVTDSSVKKKSVVAYCTATKKIVFIKTHKTASTTLASIFERYGYFKGLSFAQPRSGHCFSETLLFDRGMVQPVPSGQYDLITNHARYNRREMEAVNPKALYITVLREPTSQLESAFGFYKMASKLNILKYRNPFSRFMDNPGKFLNLRQDFHLWTQMRNGQIFDLGLDHRYHDNITVVEEKIRQLDGELDFVLITEYFDESLLLLRRFLCFEMNDIIYISNAIRARTLRYRLDDAILQKGREWNAADVKLYNHFNQTLWRKIAQYGPDFDSDLASFQKELQRIKTECIVPNRYRSLVSLREERLVLKRDASPLCQQLWYGDTEYTQLIRNKQSRLGRNSWLPLYANRQQSFGRSMDPTSNVLIWVWVVVIGGMAWCGIACCVACYCDRNGDPGYYDDYIDDEEYDLMDTRGAEQDFE